MTKKEIIEILKESLTIEVVTDTRIKESASRIDDDELEVEVNVRLVLDGELLSTGVSAFTVPWW